MGNMLATRNKLAREVRSLVISRKDSLEAIKAIS